MCTPECVTVKRDTKGHYKKALKKVQSSLILIRYIEGCLLYFSISDWLINCLVLCCLIVSLSTPFYGTVCMYCMWVLAH